jgi:hypothetical protein
MAQKNIGNQFWKMRSSHGRDLLFASPLLLWESACEYFEWCTENPWLKSESIKSGELAGTTMTVPISRPFTMQGLCIYLDCSTSYFREFKRSRGDSNIGFMSVIEKIEEVVYQQQFEGATVGAFNANIIARALGLTDKQVVDHNGISELPKINIINLGSGEDPKKDFDKLTKDEKILLLELNDKMKASSEQK